MPNAPMRSDPFDCGSHETEKPFHQYLLGSEEDGSSFLPEATLEILDTTRDVEFVHPRYGRVRATYRCASYKHYKNRFYRWSIESAEQLDPDAPRPKAGQSGNPEIRFYTFGEPPTR
ncbi:MAG: hypothetical protein WBC18_12615 [Ottowia sp.]|uniref:hypothetical protein n=1 Tax=Ottowia sp. TaxID=1898956 RepID=UPI003C760077